jgi:hypothetical protein
VFAGLLEDALEERAGREEYRELEHLASLKRAIDQTVRNARGEMDRDQFKAAKVASESMAEFVADYAKKNFGKTPGAVLKVVPDLVRPRKEVAGLRILLAAAAGTVHGVGGAKAKLLKRILDQVADFLFRSQPRPAMV